MSTSTIRMRIPEFTCLCPRSGYPDFATVHLVTVPDRKVLELKHLKLWLNSYRERRISHVQLGELSYIAAARALACAGMEGRQLELIVMGTTSYDDQVPNVAVPLRDGMRLQFGRVAMTFRE